MRVMWSVPVTRNALSGRSAVTSGGSSVMPVRTDPGRKALCVPAGVSQAVSSHSEHAIGTNLRQHALALDLGGVLLAGVALRELVDVLAGAVCGDLVDFPDHGERSVRIVGVCHADADSRIVLDVLG